MEVTLFRGESGSPCTSLQLIEQGESRGGGGIHLKCKGCLLVQNEWKVDHCRLMEGRLEVQCLSVCMSTPTRENIPDFSIWPDTAWKSRETDEKTDQQEPGFHNAAYLKLCGNKRSLLA